MRVIAGKARRLSLETIPGMDTRPTTDRIKETLFNMLQPDLYGKKFLDLFSGSGAIGIEALSRGCSHCTFVEKNPKASECIRRNLVKTRLDGDAELLNMDVFYALSMLKAKEQTFDLIFMDPPYGKELEKQALEALADSPCLHEDTLVIVEADLTTDFSWLESMGYTCLKEKRYKTNRHVFITKK